MIVKKISFAVFAWFFSMAFFALADAGYAAGLVGQERTCGAGPQQRVVTLAAAEKIVDLGEGVKTEAWTFNGTSPGPTIEACEGDTLKLTLKNDGKMAHGFDSHALRMDPMHFGPADSGKSLTLDGKLATPGVFMYHCASGAATDQHIKMGMFGTMIVYPRGQKLRPAREIVISENGIYGSPNDQGTIAPSSERMEENRAYIVAYNGTLKHDAIEANAGELVRVYFVNAGPFTSSFHVMGVILDRAYEGGNPRNVAYDVQSYAVPAGSGGMFEFTLPEAGTYMVVDHDKLAQLANGLAIPIVAKPIEHAAAAAH
jgi:nitrite reductase (NO-forming)